MADTGKQSPLGINVLGSVVQNIGFWINPTAQSYMGVNKTTEGNYTLGKVCRDTSLLWITYAINDAFKRGSASTADPATDTSGTVNSTTYNNLVTVGQSRVPALGNSPPPTWETSDPGNVWVNHYTSLYSLDEAGSPATSSYGFYNWTASFDSYTANREEAFKNEGQLASWYPMLCTTPTGDVVPNKAITQWGWVRCIALQAWQDFNFNGETATGDPEYKFFCDSFNSFFSYMNYTNQAIYAVQDSKTFLQGTYSNQDDLISADVSGVSLSSRAFGQDLINLGKAIDFEYMKTFGMPSNVLKILQKNNALTQAVIVGLLTAGLSQNEINNISNGNITPTKDQEQKIYGALLVVVGSDLLEVLSILNCNTKGLQSLADLVNIKKLFPISYTTLTVPIYNTAPGPTNSKTYYLLYVKQELNPQLIAPKIKEIVKEIVPPQPPPVIIEPPPLPPPPPPPKQPEPEVIIIPQPPSVPAPNPVVPPTQPTGGGGCVALESYVPYVETDRTHNGRDIEQAWMLEEGMSISLGTDKLEVVEGKVKKVLNDLQPCVRIQTVDGISLVCSTTAPIYTKEKGFIPATEVYDKHVAVMLDDHVFFSRVDGLQDMKTRFVRVVDAGNNSFWAGERPGAYILHHNVPIKENLDYDKK